MSTLRIKKKISTIQLFPMEVHERGKVLNCIETIVNNLATFPVSHEDLCSLSGIEWYASVGTGDYLDDALIDAQNRLPSDFAKKGMFLFIWAREEVREDVMNDFWEFQNEYLAQFIYGIDFDDDYEQNVKLLLMISKSPLPRLDNATPRYDVKLENARNIIIQECINLVNLKDSDHISYELIHSSE